MAKSSKKKSASNPRNVFRRYITRREAYEAANKLRITSDGERYVIRFSMGQRVEHLLLILSFTMLAVTGLSQTYYETRFGNLILNLFGGIDSIRQVHHIIAFLFALQAMYHVWQFFYNLVVFRRIGMIWPDSTDLQHFWQMLKLNLGISKSHPRFGRYTFEEKVEYWALVWGTIVMGISGIMQWFPLLVTEFLPGWAIPVARALHRLEAILAVLAILIWHTYHTVLKTLNTSIFTGHMSIEEMEAEHPVELAYLEQAAAVAQNNRWPVLIEIPMEVEPASASEPQPKETKAVVTEDPENA